MYATSDATITVYPEDLASLFYANDGRDIVDQENEPTTPNQFLAQKQKRMARQQIDQRNDRIKAWEDKRKRFK
jgi:hypothetical protein